MKRTFEFEQNNDKYTLKNTAPHEKKDPFEIDKSKKEFDTKKFYQYVFSDISFPIEIEIIDKATSDDKETQRVYGIINDIVQGVVAKLNNK